MAAAAVANGGPAANGTPAGEPAKKKASAQNRKKKEKQKDTAPLLDEEDAGGAAEVAWGVKGVDAKILALAIPALGTLVIDPLMSVVDTVYVGRLGAESLASLGIASAVFSFSFLLFNFLSTVTGPLVAQALARGDRDSAAGTVGQALTLAALIGTTSMAVLEVSTYPVLEAVSGAGGGGGGAELLPLAASYLHVRALGMPAVLISTASGGAFRGMLDTRTPLFVAVGANLANFVLDPILIFCTPLGVSGAALATVLAEWGAAGTFLFLLFNREELPRPRIGLPAWVDVKPLVLGGAAVLTRTAAIQGALLTTTSTVAGTATEASGGGAAVVAAHQVGMQLFFFLAFALDSLAVAAQSLVADAVGRGDKPAAREAAERAALYALGLGAALGVTFTGAARPIAALFSQDPEVQEAALVAIRYVALLQPVNGLVYVGDGVFQGAADFNFLAAGMAAAVGVGMVVLAAGPGDLEGAWQALSVIALARAAGLGWRYWKGPLR